MGTATAGVRTLAARIAAALEGEGWLCTGYDPAEGYRLIDGERTIRLLGNDDLVEVEVLTGAYWHPRITRTVFAEHFDPHAAAATALATDALRD